MAIFNKTLINCFIVQALISAILFLVSPKTALAVGLTNDLVLSGVVGARNGNSDDTVNKPNLGLVGMRAHHTEIKMGENQLSLLALGVNLQTDGYISPSISPVSVLSKDGFTFSVDVYPKTGNSSGGGVGISMGIVLK
jgi:hypothetical protein